MVPGPVEAFTVKVVPSWSTDSQDLVTPGAPRVARIDATGAKTLRLVRWRRTYGRPVLLFFRRQCWGFVGGINTPDSSRKNMHIDPGFLWTRGDSNS